MRTQDDNVRSVRRLVMCGTDTGVGKTHVGVAIARALRARGRRVGVLKPIESGVEDGRPADATALAEAAGVGDVGIVCPWPLPRPVAPAVELERLGLRVTAADLTRAIAEAERGCEVLVVETAGGILSPLTPTLTSADLATLVEAGTVLVVRSVLGCISHAAAAAEVLRDRGARLEAIVLNEADGPSELHSMNAEWIGRACPDVRVVRYTGDPAPLLDALRLVPPG